MSARDERGAAAPDKDGERIVLGSRSHRHLAHAVLLEEAAAPHYIRLTIAMVVTGLVAFIGWASVAELDEIAAAPGQIVPAGTVRVVQHVDGGAVARIAVAEGERVTRGQLLVELDAVETEAELKVAEARYWALAARLARLRAQAEGRWADDVSADIPEAYRALARDQRDILDSHRNAIGNQEKVIRAQAQQFEAELARVESQMATARREIRILKEVSSIRGDLERDRLATRMQTLEAERALVVQEGELQKLLAQRRALQANLSESRARLRSLASDRRQAAHDEMGAASAEFAQVGELLVKLRKRLSRVQVTAPVDGIVQDLRYRTIGAVLPPGATISNVVPVDDVLQAEVRIAATDVGHVRVGQRVRVKVLTYDFLRYGTIDGFVAAVSATSFVDEKNTPYFKGIVALTRSHLGARADDHPVLPGMTVLSDIVTDRKSVLAYLARPVATAFRQGLRER